METCIETFDSGQSKQNDKGRQPRKAIQSRFLPVHPKLSPLKVNDSQLVLVRDMVDDKLLIHDPVAQPQDPDCEVFAPTAVATLPR